MKLPEFLLARIAEDEASADEVHRYGCDVFADDGRGNCDCGRPVRDLAKCKADRRIVERWREATAAADHISESFDGDDSPRARVERACYNATEHAWWAAVEIAALPYADHPDYRETWKL